MKVACRGGGCTAAVTDAQCTSGFCRRCYRRQWYFDNGEHERAMMALWRERNDNHDRQRWADYYADNGERLRARRRDDYANDPDEARARAARYRAENREAIRQRSRARRLADPNWAPRNRENVRNHRGDGDVNYAAILAEHGMVCHICTGTIEGPADLHMDHVIPLSRGGLHDSANLRPAHAICNLRKGARSA